MSLKKQKLLCSLALAGMLSCQAVSASAASISLSVTSNNVSRNEFQPLLARSTQAIQANQENADTSSGVTAGITSVIAEMTALQPEAEIIPVSKNMVTTAEMQESVEEVQINSNEIEVVNPKTQVTIVEAQIEFPQNRWGITLSDYEKDLLARIVWLEARGECEEGQRAVVEVIFNRMTSPRYSNSLEGVISQSGQFETYPHIMEACPTEKEYRAIEAVLAGCENELSADTIYFATTALTTDVDRVIGGHIFCR